MGSVPGTWGLVSVINPPEIPAMYQKAGDGAMPELLLVTGQRHLKLRKVLASWRYRRPDLTGNQ
jgi:hypothetical protein